MNHAFPGNLRVVAVSLSCAIALMCGRAEAADVFIGTLSVKGEALVLERCDLARNTYVLRDAEGTDAVAALLRGDRASEGFWYGEVIGDYVEIDGGNGLQVSSIGALQAGKSCHLTDMVGARLGAAPQNAPLQAQPTAESRHEE